MKSHKERYIKFVGEWEQSVIFGGFWRYVSHFGYYPTVWIHSPAYYSNRTSFRNISNGLIR